MTTTGPLRAICVSGDTSAIDGDDVDEALQTIYKETGECPRVTEAYDDATSLHFIVVARRRLSEAEVNWLFPLVGKLRNDDVSHEFEIPLSVSNPVAPN